MGQVDARITSVNRVLRDGFETLNLDNWDISVGAGDLVELAGNTAGSGYVKISKSVDNDDTETTFLSKFIVDSPVKIGFGMSLSQRLAHQRFSIELVGINDQGNVLANVPAIPVFNVSSISQTTGTLTVTTSTPHGLVPGDRVAIYGCNDSRMNFGEVYVATISNATTFTVTATPYGNITSQTIAALTNTGYVVKTDPFNFADNALGVFWEGISANNAKLISRTHGGPLFNGNDTSMGTNNTVASQPNANAYADSFNPTYMYDIRFKSEGVIVRTLPLDSLSGPANTVKRSQVIPDIIYGYKIRLKARNNAGMTRSMGGGIVSASKTGTTTTTIVTAQPHSLNTGDYVTIYGIRDQTNFVNLTVATAITVVNATTFTVVMGAAATATSFGGAVIKMQGGTTIAVNAQVVQSITRTNNEMTVVGNTAWTGLTPGETVQLVGLVDVNNGVPYNHTGPYRVLSVSATSLLLASLGPDFATLNVGGAVLKRTDFRLHLFRALDYTRTTVEIDGSIGNNSDSQEALPVTLTSTSLTVASGQVAHDSVISGSPVRIGARAISANYGAVASGDAADLISTLVGALIQKPYSIPEADWTFAVAAPITTVADTVLTAAAGAGIRNYMTGLQMINTSATATEVVIKDGAVVIWRGYLPASMSQVVYLEFPTPLRTTANTALNFAAITTAANIYVNAQGYKAP